MAQGKKPQGKQTKPLKPKAGSPSKLDGDLLGEGRPVVDVRGVTAVDLPAGLGVRLLALLIDTACVLAIVSFGIKILNLSPLPSWWATILLALGALLFVLLQQSIWGGTLGQRLWKLRILQRAEGPTPRPLRFTDPFTPSGFGRYWRSEVRQQEKLEVASASTAAFISFIMLGGCFWIMRETFWKHPLLAQAETWKLPAYAPPAGSNDWRTLPLFYSLGAWPARFNGAPVLHSLPYEKGPPTQFIGHIVARWDMPDIKATFEGPRTPTETREARDLEKLRSCLQRPWNWGCLRIRDAALMRHIQEMRAIHPKDWTVRWFLVENTALLPEEWPRGIYLSATNGPHSQDRFIFINASGSHQAFILDRNHSPQGELARQLFEQAIRSQRVSTGLEAGRAWADRALTGVRMDDLRSLENQPQTLVERIAEIQTLLLSKVSVDPKSYDAYFHLGGTSAMLARQSMKSRVTEWGAAARPTLLSSLRYAQDMGPLDPRTKQLQTLWLELRKK